MKSTEMLNQIKTLLNIEVKLEDMKLENGTIVSAESFEKDKEIFIVTDDEKVAMPVGEYMLEDGRLLVVEEEGLISDVRDVSDEVPAKEGEDGEEITEDLKEEDEMEEEEKEMKEEEIDLGGMEKRLQSLEKKIEELYSEKEKVEAGDENGSLKSRTVKEEFSEASVKPIKHNPEGGIKQAPKKEFAKGKFITTLDRVLNKLNK
tara:strand:+ start:1451 stop:2062 length:612 start_codon:yes stop_codon:yes gene_type:complete